MKSFRSKHIRYVISLYYLAYVFFSLPAHATVHTYPAPAGEPLSPLFTVKAAGHEVPVYLTRVMAIAETKPEARVTGQASIASFDMDSPVEITVSLPEPAYYVKLLPTSAAIKTTLSNDHTITFTIPKPGQYVLEINGDWMNSLQIFADPFETEPPPNPKDPNVIYYGPGLHVIGSLNVPSGKTIYVAGGAIVYGKELPGTPGGPMFNLMGDDITIRGRGVIDGSLVPRPSHGGHILQVKGKNIHIEGVTLRDASTWTFVINQSDQVHIDNVKIFGWRGSSDGIDINGSSNVTVENSFVRTWDDLIVVKTNTPGFPTHDVSVKHCVLWNEKAHALSIGAELRDKVTNVNFSDNDIIHDKGHTWLLRIFNGDSGAVSHVNFDNIRIEESRRFISLWIGQTRSWSRDADRGHIDDVTFSNITSPIPVPDPAAKPATLKSFDAQHAIHGVKFINVVLGGKPFTAEDIDKDEFATDVTVTP